MDLFRQIKENKRLGFMLFSVASYKFILHIIYSLVACYRFTNHYLYPSFSNHYSFWKDLFSWGVALLVAVILADNSREYNISNQIWSMILIFSFLPGLVYFVYGDIDYAGAWFLYFLVFAVAMKCIPPIRLELNKKMSALLGLFARLIGAALILIVFVIWAYYSHFHIQLDFVEVYETRAMAKSYKLPTILSYGFAMSKTVIPIYAAYYLYKKKYVRVVVYSAVQFINFCVDGTKGSIAYLGVVYLGFILVRIVKDYIKYIPVALAIVGLLGFLEFYIFSKIVIISMIFRRVLFVPNVLNRYYYDFFLTHPIDYYRKSINILGQSAYEARIPEIIGEIYCGSGHANNGLFSDAWANLGIWGMIIMPVMIVLVIKFMDIATKRFPKEVYLVVVIEVGLLWISSSYFTNLLSHGIGLITVVMFLLGEEERRTAPAEG